jgi:ABC-type multidrug transport system fused ATPase/permease subunit
MAFDDLKKDLTEADVDVRSYLENSEEYIKLKVFKALMQGVTAFTHVMLIGAIGLLALFLLSFAASYGIGNAMNNTYQGFIVVGMFYVVVALLCYVFRDRLDRPILKKFSKYYFDRL